MANKRQANYICDLHSHTNRSDGKDAPAELIDNAVEKGLKVLILSDHDIVPPNNIEVNGTSTPLCEYAASKGLYLIPGIEVSCETTVDDTHLVCFGCDWNDPFFAQLERFTVNSKIKAYRELVDRAYADGFPITWEKVLSRNGQALSSEQVQKKMIFEALAEAGFASTWVQAKKNVNANPKYYIAREKPDATSVIHNVHRTGGYVILAHPFLIPETFKKNDEEMDRKTFIDSLLSEGLDGIEARYPYQKTSYIGTKSDKEIEEYVFSDYADKVKIVSGGSDYHAEHKDGVASPRLLGECGLTWEEFKMNPILQQVVVRLYGHCI